MSDVGGFLGIAGGVLTNAQIAEAIVPLLFSRSGIRQGRWGASPPGGLRFFGSCLGASRFRTHHRCFIALRAVGRVPSARDAAALTTVEFPRLGVARADSAFMMVECGAEYVSTSF